VTLVCSLVRLNEDSDVGSDTRHDVLLIYDDKGELPPLPCEVHRLSYRPGEFWGATRKARRILRGYDAVLVHAAHPAVVLAVALERKPCFLFQHGMTVSSGSPTSRRLRKVWYSWFPRLLRSRVICSTRYAALKTERLGIALPPERVSIVPFGIALDSWPPKGRAPSGRSEVGVHYIGMAGRLVRQKRQGLVLESLKGYRGEARICLRVAGEGEERGALEALAREVPPDRVRVEFLGAVRDMRAFYEGLDLLVFPSAGESFGLVVLEALACGTPVAVFPDVGGALVLIDDGRNGLVLPEGSNGLSALWASLDEDPGLLTRLRQGAADTDLSPYDIATTRATLESLVATV